MRVYHGPRRPHLANDIHLVQFAFIHKTYSNRIDPAGVPHLKGLLFPITGSGRCRSLSMLVAHTVQLCPHIAYKECKLKSIKEAALYGLERVPEHVAPAVRGAPGSSWKCEASICPCPTKFVHTCMRAANTGTPGVAATTRGICAQARCLC